MSRLNTPGIASRPSVNVYTGLAFISMLATLIALVVVLVKVMDLGVFR